MTVPPSDEGLIITPNTVRPGDEFFIISTGWDAGEIIDYAWPNIKFTYPVQADVNGKLIIREKITPNRAIQTYLIRLIGRINRRQLEGYVDVVEIGVRTPLPKPPQVPTPKSEPTPKQKEEQTQTTTTTTTTTPSTTPKEQPSTLPAETSISLGDWGILNPIRDIAKNVVNLIDVAIKDGEKLVNDGLKAVHNVFPSNKPVVIEDTPVLALEIAGVAMGASFGIYTLTTATDLLHPIKGTGIVPMGIDIVDKLGTGLITGTVIGAAALAVLGTPLKYYWNQAVRPHRPDTKEADRMFFKQGISSKTWRRLFEYQGWPDELINAWELARYQDVSPRLLIKMFDDPNLDIEWVQKVLVHSGLDLESINNVVNFARFAATEKTKGTSQTVSLSRYKKGYINAKIFDAELGTVPIKSEAIKKTRLLADIAVDEAEKDSRIAALDEAYLKEVITESEFTIQISNIILNEVIRNNHISLYKSKKIHLKSEATRTRKISGHEGIVIQQFVEGQITLQDMQNELLTLNKNTQEIEVIKSEALLTKSLHEYKLAKTARDNALSDARTGRASSAIDRFKRGFTDDKILEVELHILGTSPKEVPILVSQARLERDSLHRTNFLAEYKAAYGKDLITRDEFIIGIKRLVTDETIAAQIIDIEDFKKVPKPKPVKI